MLFLQWRDSSQIYPTIPIMRKPTLYQSIKAKRRTQSLVIGVTWYTPENSALFLVDRGIRTPRWMVA